MVPLSVAVIAVALLPFCAATMNRVLLSGTAAVSVMVSAAVAVAPVPEATTVGAGVATYVNDCEPTPEAFPA